MTTPLPTKQALPRPRGGVFLCPQRAIPQEPRKPRKTRSLKSSIGSGLPCLYPQPAPPLPVLAHANTGFIRHE